MDSTLIMKISFAKRVSYSRPGVCNTFSSKIDRATNAPVSHQHLLVRDLYLMGWLVLLQKLINAL